jgi:hypothetical protein
MQQPSYFDVLRERYRFDEWKNGGPARPSTEGGTRGALTFRGDELPGWRLVRQTARDAPPPGHPPFTRSVWQGDSPEQLAGVDVYACASSAAAREYLLRLLGEFQGPALTRAAALDVGDVAFVTPGDAAVLFARGSLVAVVRNAGRRVEPLGSVARALDAALGAAGRER